MRDFHGLELELRRTAGARSVRVVHPRGQTIAAHGHDWACLTLFSLGAYQEQFDGGEVTICGPAAVLQPPGRAHANRIDEHGLETVSIQFDPAWLAVHGWSSSLDAPRCWRGGAVAIAAQRLATVWTSQTMAEAGLAEATADFLHLALTSDGASPAPTWLRSVTEAIRSDQSSQTSVLARRLDLHPAWLARAYRAAAGEGLHATARRHRVERAMTMLRSSDLPAAQVAVAAGFCDQSHMNRAFREFAGRTPQQVREERAQLAFAA